MKEFHCKRCGFCCKGNSTVGLSEEEIQRIADFLGFSKEEFLEKYTLKKGTKRVEMKIKDGYCIFYDKKRKRCKIHPVKPEKCKEWPFTPAIFQDEENFLIIKSSCLGLEEFTFEDITNLKVDKNQKKL
ncbi:MAG: YkgJ family cysteine cluster protein [Caldimicrobium thiodismutans]